MSEENFNTCFFAKVTHWSRFNFVPKGFDIKNLDRLSKSRLGLFHICVELWNQRYVAADNKGHRVLSTTQSCHGACKSGSLSTRKYAFLRAEETWFNLVELKTPFAQHIMLSQGTEQIPQMMHCETSHH